MISSVEAIFWRYSGRQNCKLLIKLKLLFVAPRQGFSIVEKKPVISRSKASYTQSYPQQGNVAPVGCLRHEQITRLCGLSRYFFCLTSIFRSPNIAPQ
jgi:hypothetical protein